MQQYQEQLAYVAQQQEQHQQAQGGQLMLMGPTGGQLSQEQHPVQPPQWQPEQVQQQMAQSGHMMYLGQ
jgi:hypothetical protein